MNFKQLVTAISEIHSKESFDKVCGEIDNAYSQDKITYYDHETLFKIMFIIWESVKTLGA